MNFVPPPQLFDMGWGIALDTLTCCLFTLTPKYPLLEW